MSESRANEFFREAVSLAKAGDKTKARELIKQVCELNDAHELAWLWRASLSDEPLESLKALEKVLALNPNNEHARSGIKSARLNAGVAAARLGHREQARDLLRQVCLEDMSNENAWLWLAGVTDAPAEALGHLEQVLRINPNNERAKTGAEYYRAKLKPTQPQWYCPICLTKSETRFVVCPRCSSVLSLAHANDALNNTKVDGDILREGINRLSNAVRTKPDFPTFYYLGMAMLNMSRIPEAISYFRSAKYLNPDNEAFAQHLSYLEQKTTPASPPPSASLPAKRPGSAFNRPIIPNAVPNVTKIASIPVPSKPKKCVLVVDDSPTIRKLVSMTMAKSGYRVMEAGDGNEAVDRMQAEGNPDLVLLDITMPGMDGYTFCKLIRQNQETSKIPVIMLSGKDGFFNKIRGKMCGSTLYLTKPFQPDALVRVVQKYCPVELSPALTAS